MNMRTLRIVVGLVSAVLAALLGGCASTAPGALSERQLEVFDRLDARLEANRPALEGALDDLEAQSADALTTSHSLSLDLAKAQLLEAMRTPWLDTDSERTTTRRQVALYRLYALIDAEREVLDARLRERRAALQEVATASAQLTTLVEQAIAAQKLLVAELNQPRGVAVGVFLRQVLAETRAFRERLESSDNPTLRALAAEVESAEGGADAAQQAIVKALEVFESKKDTGDAP